MRERRLVSVGVLVLAAALAAGSGPLCSDDAAREGGEIGRTRWWGPVSSVVSGPFLTRKGSAVPVPLSSGRILVYPNPFNPKRARGGTLKFEGVPASATVLIYTVTSIRVRELAPPHKAPIITWNGLNENGVAVAPGIYVWSVEGGGVTERGVLVVE